MIIIIEDSSFHLSPSLKEYLFTVREKKIIHYYIDQSQANFGVILK